MMQFPELQYQTEVRFVKIAQNNTIAYTDSGQGDIVLLFVHGLASYLKGWLKLLPLLNNKFRCIALDLPGYGMSEAGVHEGSQSFYADCLYQFITTMHIKNCIAVGHSMGGQIVLAAAIRHPDIFNKTVLLAPAGIEQFSADEIALIKEQHKTENFIHATEQQIFYSYALNFFSMPEDIDIMISDRRNMRMWPNFNNYAQVVTNSLYGMLDAPVIPRIGEIEMPIHILFGSKDKLIPHPVLHPDLKIIDLLESVKKRNTLLSFEIIPECGHFIPWEKPEIVANYIIEQFL